MSVEVSNRFDEDANNNILLLGSGASKDFGGLLIPDIWDEIYNNDSATNHIKKLLREYENYEKVYSLLENKEEKSTLIKILKTIFEKFDIEMLRSENPYEMLHKFIELFQSPGRFNFVFTTNQDLLIERCFLNYGVILQAKCNDPEEMKKQFNKNLPLNFPYSDYTLVDVVKKEGHPTIQYQNSYSFDSFVRTIQLLENNEGNIDTLNFVKLHGSFNWKHSDEYIVQITGNDKILEINESKILNYSIQLFAKILSKKKTVVIVGYGFNDPHINDSLLKSVDNGSDFVIVNRASWKQFKKPIIQFTGCQFERVIKKKTTKIFDAILKYYPVCFRDYLKNENIESLKKILKT